MCLSTFVNVLLFYGTKHITEKAVKNKITFCSTTQISVCCWKCFEYSFAIHFFLLSTIECFLSNRRTFVQLLWPFNCKPFLLPIQYLLHVMFKCCILLVGKYITFLKKDHCYNYEKDVNIEYRNIDVRKQEHRGGDIKNGNIEFNIKF